MTENYLCSFGIDYGKGLHRCMDDEGLYRKVLSMFLADDLFAQAEAAAAGKDYKLLFACMHQLKGNAGSLELTDLVKEVSQLVEILRYDNPDEQEVNERFENVREAFDIAVQGVPYYLV